MKPEGPLSSPPAASVGDRTALLWQWIGTNHYFNSSLWAEEDLARRTTVSDTEIALNKRAIDKFNQARNDATERVDEILLTELGLWIPLAQTDAPLAKAPANARLNSETAGSIIDHMSIIAAKRFMPCGRKPANGCGRQPSSQQPSQSSPSFWSSEEIWERLDALIEDTQAGRAYFKVYRQFKMYNDPRFNPALVAEQQAKASR